jgi:hypothetical protein
MALGSTQPLRVMSTRILPRVKGQLVHKADSLTTICKPVVKKMGSLHVLQSCEPPRPVNRASCTFFDPSITIHHSEDFLVYMKNASFCVNVFDWIQCGFFCSPYSSLNPESEIIVNVGNTVYQWLWLCIINKLNPKWKSVGTRNTQKVDSFTPVVSQNWSSSVRPPTNGIKKYPSFCIILSLLP